MIWFIFDRTLCFPCSFYRDLQVLKSRFLLSYSRRRRMKWSCQDITRNWKADQLSAPWLGWLGRTFHVWGSPGHYCWYRNPSHGACPSPQSALLSLLLGLPLLLPLLLFLLPAVMDYSVSPTEHICYVRCSYCNTVLKVIPWSRRLKMNVPQQCCFWVYKKDVHQKSIRFSKLLGVHYLRHYFTSYFSFFVSTDLRTGTLGEIKLDLNLLIVSCMDFNWSCWYSALAVHDVVSTEESWCFLGFFLSPRNMSLYDQDLHISSVLETKMGPYACMRKLKMIPRDFSLSPLSLSLSVVATDVVLRAVVIRQILCSFFCVLVAELEEHKCSLTQIHQIFELRTA